MRGNGKRGSSVGMVQTSCAKLLLLPKSCAKPYFYSGAAQNHTLQTLKKCFPQQRRSNQPPENVSFLPGGAPPPRTPMATGRTRPFKKRFLGWKSFLVDLEPLEAVLSLNSVRIGISVKNWYRKRSLIYETRLQGQF